MKIKFDMKYVMIAIGMFCLGATVTSIFMKNYLVEPQSITDFSKKWVCSTSVSYTGDLIMLVISLIFIYLFTREAKEDESNDTSS